MPATLSSKDVSSLTLSLQGRLKSSQNLDCLLFAETFLVLKSFLSKLNKNLEAEMEEKSGEDLRKPNYVLAIKSENAVASNGGVGGTGATSGSNSVSGGKSKGKSKSKAAVVEEDSSLAPLEIQFIDRSGLLKHLKSSLNEANDDLVDSLVDHLLRFCENKFYLVKKKYYWRVNYLFFFSRSLNVQYLELLKTKIEKGLISTSKSGDKSTSSSATGKDSTSDMMSKPPSIKDVQEKVKIFLINVRVFDRALKLFSGV